MPGFRLHADAKVWLSETRKMLSIFSRWQASSTPASPVAAPAIRGTLQTDPQACSVESEKGLCLALGATILAARRRSRRR